MIPNQNKTVIKSNNFRILYLGDYKAATGYATVSHQIIHKFKQHFGKRLFMDIVAINYWRDEKPGPSTTEHDGQIRVIPAYNEKSIANDLFGRHEFLALLAQNDYDLVFILQDIGIIQPIIRTMADIKLQKRKDNKRSFKTIYYFPLDGGFLPEWFDDDMGFFDELVTYTEFGKNQIVRANQTLRKRIKVIPHGTDIKTFRILPDEEKISCRREYFGDNSDKLIIANINRNQPRKDIPSTIFAFEEYHRRINPHSFLYLHMNPEDPQGWNLRTIFKQTDLVEGQDYGFSKREFDSISPEFLNQIYNSCDIYLTTTTGEGWGLTVTEAMAAMLPVICPMHTSLYEIGGASLNDDGDEDRVIYLKQHQKYCSHFDNMVREGVEIADVVDSIDFLGQEIISMKAGQWNQAHHDRVVRALEYVESNSWDIVTNKWVSLIENYV